MKKNNKGFTLIEVAFAIFIAMPMLIIIMRLVPGMLKSMSLSEDYSKITLLAETKMETIRMYVKSSNVLFGYNADYAQEGTPFAEPFQKYKSKITDTKVSNQKNITIFVWKDPNDNNVLDAKESFVQLNTIITGRN